MTLRNVIIILYFFVPVRLHSQVLPGEGRDLPYRLIGFSFPADKKAGKYKIEIAAGNFKSEDSFSKNIIITETGKTNKILAEVPSYGTYYTWRFMNTGKNIAKGPLYHFHTTINPRVDTAVNRLRILQQAETNSDGYVTVEGIGVIYDMKGNPVWSISDTAGMLNSVSDIKFTRYGTITYLSDQMGHEINYDSKVLWATPIKDSLSGKNPDLFHNEFTRLPNGHYLSLGVEYLLCNKVSTNDDRRIVAVPDRSRHPRYHRIMGNRNKGVFGTLVEFDENDNIVWFWKSSKYLLNADFAYFNPADSNRRFDPRDNAFYFDDKSSAVYLGFMNLSRIIKIAYPGGDVLNAYGEVFKKNIPQNGNGMFCNQHSISRSQDGNLLVFNNNSCVGSQPEVVVLEEPVAGAGELKKVWSYPCPVENASGVFPLNGNVKEMPDRSLLVCISKVGYSKIFIVNMDKKILWSAVPETNLPTEKKWTMPEIYRANFISRSEMENLVWKAQAK